MQVIHFVHSSVIDASVETVFAFHERPDVLSLLIPPGPDIRIVERSGPAGLAVGARVVLRFPLGVRWVALHTEYEPNRLFVDIQASGPCHFWEHKHVFAPEPAGPQGATAKCRLTDSIRFSLPPWGLLDFALGWIVKLQLRSMFRYRHEVTARECEAGPARRPQP